MLVFHHPHVDALIHCAMALLFQFSARFLVQVPKMARDEEAGNPPADQQ